MDKLLILSLVVNIFFILLLIYLIKSPDTCIDYPLYNNILLSNIPFKSGDLLLFSHSSCNIITRTLGNIFYSHFGIVVEKEGRFYSMELVEDDYVSPGIKKKNLILVPIEERITNYSGKVYFKELKNKLENHQKDKLIEISSRDIRFTTLNNCGSFISDVLDEIGVKKKINHMLFWKIHDSIIYSDKFNTPILISPDTLMINNIKNNKTMNLCS
jgi:hypothetical protein